MAGRPGIITASKYLIGGFNVLFLLLIPLTRGGGGGEVLLYDELRAAAPEAADKNPAPLFTLSFNVEEHSDTQWEVAYRRLIQDLRRQLTYRIQYDVPVLRPQRSDETIPSRWFHLVLQRGVNGVDGSVTLRIRMDNLYVVGFRREGGAADDGRQWWECMTKGSTKNTIIDSKPTGFSCNYNHIEETAGQSTTSVGCGRHRLRDVVGQLANVRQPDRDQGPTARSMLVVIIMVSEATRFREIADLFLTDRGDRDPDGSVRLTERMDALIRGWGDVSARVIRTSLKKPTHTSETFPLTLRRGEAVVELGTSHVAALLLGIMLLPSDCDWGPEQGNNNNIVAPALINIMPAVAVVLELGGGGGGRAAAASSSVGHTNNGHCAEGRPLLEVISVVINDIDGENPGQLFGTVRVTDALGTQSIYDRDRYNYEEVSPGGAAMLTGPSEDRAISALETVTGHLDLWDRDFLSYDDQVSKGAFEWDHLAFPKRYDTRLSQTIRGGAYAGSSATVNYVVFHDAVEAKFEVILVQGSDGEYDQVYGRIVAQINGAGNQLGMIESVLLSTTSSDYSDVWYGSRIPLQRRVMAVPLSSYIRVSALLYDYDKSSAADEIAGGCTYFGAKSSGTTRWRITGQYGVIEVQVTWNHHY